MPASLAFVNGAVFTGEAARSWCHAVAVDGGRIVAVGSDKEIGEHIGPTTEVVDLGGRLLVPGFQDAHCHPVSSGLELLGLAMLGIETRSESLEAIAAYAAAQPDKEWILGGGWSMGAFPGGTPLREDLDGIVPDRPVFLTNRDGHGAWVNSRALEIAGVDPRTPDPPDGRIERRPDGTPAGTLQEGAMALVRRHQPPTTQSEWRAALEAGQRYMLDLGITGWQDAAVESDVEDAYRWAAANGKLQARVVGALWWERDRGAEQIDELLERRNAADRFSPTTVKLMLDGVAENFTASMLEPYLDEGGLPSERRGIDFIDPDELGTHVTRLDAAGFQCHFHAIGDRAVRSALDAVATARRANGWNDLRHHVAHIQVIHPDDLARFRRLGVTANAQPLWAQHEEYQRDLTIPHLGEPRWLWQYPFASLIRNGAQLAVGSDWGVSTADPWKILEVAVRRIDPGNREADPFLPDERLDLPTALAAATAGSAWVNHLDRETGTIETGKLADLVVADRDPFEALDAIGDTRTVATLIEGEVVAGSL
jgi:predicted amidohydrolase YtcJ